MSNPYTEAAQAVLDDYEAQRHRAGDETRKAHLNARVAVCNQLIEYLDSATDKDSALASVKSVRETMDSDPGSIIGAGADRRTTEAGIEACIVIRAKIEALA